MPENLTPEERARILIDEQLTEAGWVVQDRKNINLVSHVGVAVMESVLKNVSGRADYLLYLNRKIVGVIEAKPSGIFGSKSTLYYPVKTADNMKEYGGVMAEGVHYVIDEDKIIFPQKRNS